jgi:hypothetical protein
MRRVRCVSPHGGAHNGLRADNEQPAPPGYAGRLMLPPNEGGWVWNATLGHVAVGDEADAPDDFICDNFHFTDAAPVPPAAEPAQSAIPLADLLKKGDG